MCKTLYQKCECNTVLKTVELCPTSKTQGVCLKVEQSTKPTLSIISVTEYSKLNIISFKCENCIIFNLFY